MGVISYDIKGLDVTLKGIDNLSKEVEGSLKDEFKAWAQSTATMAKQSAPKDTGRLQQNIYANTDRIDNLSVSVNVVPYYGAYQEFGTGEKAASYVPTLPKQWQDEAAKHRGRKQIKRGINPVKFLFRAYEFNINELKKNLKTLFK